jgi:hypothetical protein
VRRGRVFFSLRTSLQGWFLLHPGLWNLAYFLLLTSAHFVPQSLSENQLTRVLAHIVEMDVNRGVQVLPDSFYFIAEGSIILDGKWEQVKNRPILTGMRDAGAATTTLQKFSFFGDRELLTGAGGFTYTAGSGGVPHSTHPSSTHTSHEVPMFSDGWRSGSRVTTS